MKLSILTICRNDLAGLRRTVSSVEAQSRQPDEFLVLDGGSDDGTVDFLKVCDSVTLWRSEPDRGIADAFNKITAMSCADWVLYLNSGDVLADCDVLRDVAGVLETRAPDVGLVYGDARLVHAGVVVGLAKGDPSVLDHRNGMCHQALFVRRTLQLENPYDQRLRIGMDYDVLLRLRKLTRFERIDRVISEYALGGISSSRAWADHSVLAHHMVRWLNTTGRKLGWGELFRLACDLIVLRAKKITESFLGGSLYARLKKVRA